MSNEPESKPVINVTPLIDVLLVLLIIFMVAAPIKPHRFKAAIPSEPEKDAPAAQPHPHTLIVSIGADEKLMLNKESNLGTVDDPALLIERLKGIFDERAANGVQPESNWTDTDAASAVKTQKTVFIKAPRTMKYLAIARVVDAIKGAGAAPISFQIDDLG